MKQTNIKSKLLVATAISLLISNPVNAGGGVPGFQGGGVPGVPHLQASGVPGAPHLQASGVPGAPKQKTSHFINKERLQASGVPGRPAQIIYK